MSAKRIAFPILSAGAFLLLTACVPPPGAEGGAAVGPMGPFEFLFTSVWFILIAIFVYYMLVLRPEAMEQDEREKFLSSLKKNDEVVTTGGIFGKVSNVKDDVITVEVASNVRLKVAARHVKPRRKTENAASADKK